MIFVWIVLFKIGMEIHAEVPFWIMYGLGVIWTVFKYLIDNAQEMEDEE